jgi:subtilase family serine protease
MKSLSASKQLLTVSLLALMFCALSFAQQSSDQEPASVVEPHPLITQPIDESQLTVLHGNTYPLARPEFDLGTAPATLPMQRMLLVLKRSSGQEAALRKLLDDQQDKSSPSYHKWLTPDALGKQFGPTDADMQTITSWLQSHGFQVGSTKGRTVLEFSGSAGQVQEAFHTTIHNYIVNGAQHWANANDPSIPTALTPAVAGVSTLNNFPRWPMSVFRGIGTREKATGRVKLQPNPQFTFPSVPSFPCNSQDNNCYSVAPYDFATIYNVLPQWNAGIDGTGQRIAIIQETNLNPADPQAFRALFGLPATPNSPNIILDGPDPGIVAPGFGLESEADIDVQWSGAVAKGATIDLVVSASTNATAGIDLSALYVIDNNLDGIVSESFGECEQNFPIEDDFYFNVWEQAAAQGISVFVASGDQGSAGCDEDNAPNQPASQGFAISGFASTPFNVAVGGTDFQDVFNPESYWNPTNDANQASAEGYIPETTWNGTCTNALFGQIPNGGFSTNPETNCNNSKLADFLAPVGGGGGASSIPYNPKPSWQAGFGDGARDVPDVSLFASSGFSGNAYVFCQSDISASGTCALTDPATDVGMGGGTSFGAPAMAGIMALINQKMGGRQGNPNYVLYNLAAQIPFANCNSTTGPASNCIFNDVTAGTIRMPCETGSPDCTTNTATDAVGVLNGYDAAVGYDLATGLGTVNVSNLVTQWQTVTFNASSTDLILNNGQPVNVMHGTSVPFEISVRGNGTNVPGYVSLIAATGPPGSISGQTSMGSWSLSGGNVVSSTSMLPGGTYNVSAHYAGDGTFAPSDSQSVQVTVTKEGSVTSLSDIAYYPFSNSQIPGNVFPFGSLVFVQAAVAGNSGSGVTAGQVEFTALAGSHSLPTLAIGPESVATTAIANPVVLNSQGNAAIGGGIVNFDAGTYNISSQYLGDSSFTSSPVSTPVGFTIQPGFTAVSGLGNTITVSPGQSGTTSVGIIASTGFSAVSISCSGLPAESTCSPTSIMPKGPTTVATTNITVSTTAPTAAMAQPPAAPQSDRPTYLFATLLSAGLPLGGIFLLATSRRHRLATLWGGMLLLALVVMLPACGGGSGGNSQPPPSPGTPAGTYTITVTLSATGAPSLQGSFTLVVK